MKEAVTDTVQIQNALAEFVRTKDSFEEEMLCRALWAAREDVEDFLTRGCAADERAAVLRKLTCKEYRFCEFLSRSCLVRMTYESLCDGVAVENGVRFFFNLLHDVGPESVSFTNAEKHRLIDAVLRSKDADSGTRRVLSCLCCQLASDAVGVEAQQLYGRAVEVLETIADQAARAKTANQVLTQMASVDGVDLMSLAIYLLRNYLIALPRQEISAQLLMKQLPFATLDDAEEMLILMSSLHRFQNADLGLALDILSAGEAHVPFGTLSAIVNVAVKSNRQGLSGLILQTILAVFETVERGYNGVERSFLHGVDLVKMQAEFASPRTAEDARLWDAIQAWLERFVLLQ